MRKSKKTIIYMLVALFVAVSTVLVDFNTSYAQSSYSDVPDADWVYISGGNINNTELNKGVLDVPSRSLPDGRPDVFVDISNCKYSETLAYYDVQSDYFVGENVTLSSDTEIVLVLDYVHAIPGYQAGTLNLFALSKSRMYFAEKGNWYWQGAWQDHGSAGKIDFTTNTYGNSDYQYFKILTASTTSSSKALEYAFMTGKMKVFSTADDAMNYLETGDTSGLAWQGGTPKQTYNSELAFTSFDMSVHDSNSFDDYYIDFLYKCPESWLGKDVKLLVNQTWDYNVYYFDIKEACNPISLQGANQSSLSISDTSIRFYLKDFKCFDELLSHNVLAATSSLQKRCILGEGSFSESFSLGGVPIKGSASTVVDKSLLSLSCVVYVDGVAGHEYVGSVDLITGDNSMATYTPDSSGNYTFNDDYKKSGHYYTNVGKDAAGNTTYNYYYYGTDGSKKDVSANDAANNTVSNTIQEGAIQNNNNPTFTNNNNITVEGDTINNDVNNYVGNNTSSETNKNFIEKFLGFFQLLENNSFLGVWGKVFGWLPPGVSSVITTALGIGACVGLFKFFRK
ncbi:MAG: hypothetical protein KH445_03765 [Clostridium sp.]|nr:hypothetical protein [Clostridium sp.]